MKRLKNHGVILYTHIDLIDFHPARPRCRVSIDDSLSFSKSHDPSNLDLKKTRDRNERCARENLAGVASELARSVRESSILRIMNTAAVCNATKIRATVKTTVVGKASSAKRVVAAQRPAQRVVKVRTMMCSVACSDGWIGRGGVDFD